MTSTSRSRLVVDPTHDGMAPGAARTETHAELRATALPPDAERMGLSAWTAPGLALASTLDPRRRSSRILAWMMLLMVLGPVLWAFGSDLASLAGH